MAQVPKLKIAIVGAGIAGLATARVVREHHDVVVFERASPDNATGGQGICFFPSTVKILKKLSYDEDRGYPCHDTFFRHYDRLGNATETVPLHYVEKYGVPMWSQLRSDCRDELYRLATGPNKEVGIPNARGSIEMRYNTAVVDLDTESGKLMLEDGTTFQADVVIVADGIHSRLRKNILGPDRKYKAQKMGLTIFRVAVPVEKAKEALGGDDNLPHWMVPDSEGKGCLTYFQSRDDSNRLIVTYPLRRFQWIHCSLHLPTGEGHGDAETESWYADADRGELLNAFADFDETLVKTVRAGTQFKVWDMQDMDSLPFWNKGKAILIGDAAHAMTPMQGQGANMAIEDAEAFSLFGPDTNVDDIPDILFKIDSVRRPRTKIVLETTRLTMPNTKMADRVERMDFINGYNGIRPALEELNHVNSADGTNHKTVANDVNAVQRGAK